MAQKSLPTEEPAEDEKVPRDFSLERTLERLEEIAALMETGALELEESMELYEEGMKLSGRCEAYLRDVKLRIEKLSQGVEPDK